MLLLRHPARKAMSSLYTRSKEYTRSRKAQSDSPPSSPSPIAKTLKVSSFFLSVLHGAVLSTCSGQRLVVVVCCLTLGDLCLCLLWKEDGLNETWEGASAATGFKEAAGALALGLFAWLAVGRCWDGSFPLASLSW